MHKLTDILEKYCERIEKELGDLQTKISKSDTLSATDLDAMDKLLHSLKSEKTVMAMLEYDEQDDEDGYSGNGYSGKRYYNDSMPKRRYVNDDGYSGRRGVPGVRGYSRDSERDDMIRRLEGIMDRARSDSEAMAIRDAIDAINRAA